MSVAVALLAMVGLIVWPGGSGLRRLEILPGASTSGTVKSSDQGSSWGFFWAQLRRWRPGHRSEVISLQDLLALLEAVAPALEAGLAPASALRIAVDSGPTPGRPGYVSSLDLLAQSMASAAAEGDQLGPLWRKAAESTGSAELLQLAHAWSLTEDMGAPLAQAVRTTVSLVEARIAQERRLAAAVAGARATVNVLTVLPIGGPLLALVIGIGPGELYAGSRLTQASLVLGLCLAGIGRWWVHRMVRSVADGPVVA